MKFVSLGNIVDIYLGITHTPEYVNEGIPFLSVKDISKGKIDFSNCKYISIDEYNSFPKGAKPQNGDILFCRVGTIGKPIIIPNDVPCFGSFVSLGFLRLKSNEWNPKFIKYWMESDLFWKQVKQNTKGASQVNLNTNWLKKFIIPNYSIEIQNKIVDKLDKITNLIILNNLNMDNLENIVKSQFIEMFESDLKGNTVKLSDVTSVITKGTTPTTLGYEFVDEGINFIKIECLTDDYQFIKDKMLHITEECNEKLKRSKLKKDDVLFSIAGAIGRTAIVSDDILPANTNQALAIIRLKDSSNLNVNFLNEMLHSTLIEEQVNNKKTGVAQTNLSLADIGNLNIIIPDIKRQIEYASLVQQIDKSKYFGGVNYGIC